MNYGTILERFAWVSSVKTPDHPRLHQLDRAMRAFYATCDSRYSYHAESEVANAACQTPAQQAILGRISPGQLVVEFSCGRGYLCEAVRRRGAYYVGFDLALGEDGGLPVSRGVRRVAIGDGYAAPIRSASADVILSFHALEHVVWPQRYLDEMIRVARPGGLIAVAFPDYVVGQDLPSMRLGPSHGGVRDKLLAGAWWDAIQTQLERHLIYRPMVRRLRRKIYRNTENVFLIYTSPSCLVASWQRDTDAIYQASEQEVALYLSRRGCRIETRSRDLVPPSPDRRSQVNSANAFVVARMPERT